MTRDETGVPVRQSLADQTRRRPPVRASVSLSRYGRALRGVREACVDQHGPTDAYVDREEPAPRVRWCVDFDVPIGVRSRGG